MEEGMTMRTEPSGKRRSAQHEQPRVARRRETEARILKTARDVLLERSSVDALPLSEVARRAGFTPGALYRYFENRDELIERLYTGALELLGSYLAAPAGETAAKRLASLARAYLKFGREHPQDLILLFESPVPTLRWDRYTTIAWPFTVIIQTMQEGFDAGELTPIGGLDVAGAAYVFWGQVHGFATLQAGHLAKVAGPFSSMHEAAIVDLVARLQGSQAQSERTPR
jgi:AcrR family transcriptional regulator